MCGYCFSVGAENVLKYTYHFVRGFVDFEKVIVYVQVTQRLQFLFCFIVVWIPCWVVVSTIAIPFRLTSYREKRKDTAYHVKVHLLYVLVHE